MVKKVLKRILFILIFPALISLQGCLQRQKEESGITVSIEPLKYFADRLTSEQVDVMVMVPMGASPATYSPTTQQLMKLSDSKLYISIGHLGFELSWMPRIKDINQDLKILTLSDEIELISAKDEVYGDHVHKGGVEPHIWMSPKTVKAFLPRLKDGLINAFPEHKEMIEKNYSELYKEVTRLHNEFTALTQTLSQKKFMIFHPALSYLARDYGLEQISIEHEGKEPSPRQLKNLIDLANRENIRLIFIQAEFDQRNAQMVKDATGAELVVINPLAYDWTENLYGIKQLLEKHLTQP